MRAALLREAIEQLRTVTDAPHLDAELLLSQLLDIDRVTLRTHADVAVPPEREALFRQWLTRRATGEPLAYILGNQEFYSRLFEVTPEVLIPRPDTEILIDWALEYLRTEGVHSVMELGVGSGCIAVTLAAETQSAHVTAIDISAEALEVARRNAQQHGVDERIDWIHGDGLSVLETGNVHHELLVSNPPYVASEDPELEKNVRRYEPALALLDPFEGDGLGFYRRIASALAHNTSPRRGPQCVLVEVGNNQAPAVQELFEKAGFTTHSRRDLAGIERVVRADRG